MTMRLPKSILLNCTMPVLMLLFSRGVLIAQYDLGRPSLLIRAEDGLPNHYFRGLAMDSNGFMWIGSYDGLSRFDGTQIKTFFHRQGDSSSLAFNAIASLATSPGDGKAWVGTYGGLSVFDPVKGKFHSFYHDAADSSSLRSNFIEWIYIDRQGEIWVSSGSQALSRYEPATGAFVHYHPRPAIAEPGQGKAPPKERILAVCQDTGNDSILWIGANLRFFSFNKYTRQFHYPPVELKEIAHIFSHADGYLYMADTDGRLKVYDPAENRLLLELHLRDGWSIHAILRRNEDALWLSCGQGVAVLDTRSLNISYPWVNDIQSKKNYDIDLVDQQGRLWSASPVGIQAFDPLTTQFNNYFFETAGDVRPYITQKIIEDSSRKCLYISIGDGDGIYRFGLESRRWELIPMPKNFRYSTFFGKDMALLNGQLLILEDVGLFTLSPDGRSIIPHPLSANLPEESSWLNFFSDSKGSLWLGGGTRGVSRMDTRTGVVEQLDPLFPGCNQRRFRYAFHEDSRGNIWISNCSGFGAYSYERDTFFLFPYSENGDNSRSINNVKDFAEGPRGQLWVSNEIDGELGRININKPEQGLYEKFSLQKKIQEGAIHIEKGAVQEVTALSKLAADSRGRLWGISPAGLVRFDPETGSLEIYNEQDGIQWLDKELKVMTANQLESLSTGELVVGFRKGLSIFDPRQLKKSLEKPRPYLTSFKIYNNEWPADSSLLYTQAIRLGHRQNYFSFDFSAIGYTHPEKYQYQYKLEGVDEDWVYAGQRNYAAYTNVAGGHYTFLVKVANSDGLWNEEAAKIRLAVATPWWRQLWFRACMLLLLLALAYGFYRYRLGQVRKTERLKARFDKKVANLELTALRAQMNPHFLFNCLNSIDHYIIKNETQKASEYLNSFSRLIRLILQNSRSNYVNLKDELETLGLYMEMESLRFNHRFEYEINADPELDLKEFEIPPMLLQPFVENAIWHGLMHKAGKGKVQLNISREDGFLKCSIQDDGVGRGKSAEFRKPTPGKRSMGMNITKDRIETINKIYNTNTTVTITDLMDDKGAPAGTKVDVLIPL